MFKNVSKIQICDNVRIEKPGIVSKMVWGFIEHKGSF